MHHPLSPAWIAEVTYRREVLRHSAAHRARTRRRPHLALRPHPAATPPRAAHR